MSTIKDKSNSILSEKNTKIIPENIKEGVQVFNVTGTLQAGTDVSDATATVDDIVENKTAYINSGKVTGNILDYRDEAVNIDYLTVKELKSASELYVSGRKNVSVSTVVNNNSTITMTIPNEKVATAIGLTADKIKQGEVILGIEGTYDGSSNV